MKKDKIGEVRKDYLFIYFFFIFGKDSDYAIFYVRA